MAKRMLTDDEIKRAYEKWCEGYTLYIERDKVIKALHDNTVEMEQTIAYPSNMGVPEDDIEDIINEIPAADVVEVRHGQWSYGYSGEKLGGTDATYDYLCSVCNEFAVEESNYCPNCGAKMDGKDIDVTTKIDRVEVVRCKDCAHWGGVTYGFVCRKFSGIETKICMHADDFCSYGERKCEDG